jgi:hypothetical protein
MADLSAIVARFDESTQVLYSSSDAAARGVADRTLSGLLLGVDPTTTTVPSTLAAREPAALPNMEAILRSSSSPFR